MAIAVQIYNALFHTTMPEIKIKGKCTSLCIVKTLFPAQYEAHFSLFACLCNPPFPEARGIGYLHFNSGSMCDWRIPAWFDLRAFKLNQTAPRLFAYFFIGAECVDCGQNIGCTCLFFLCQRLE